MHITGRREMSNKGEGLEKAYSQQLRLFGLLTSLGSTNQGAPKNAP